MHQIRPLPAKTPSKGKPLPQRGKQFGEFNAVAAGGVIANPVVEKSRFSQRVEHSGHAAAPMPREADHHHPQRPVGCRGLNLILAHRRPPMEWASS